MAIIQSKYKKTALISEDLISFHYEGIDLSTKRQVWIWHYKTEYLTPRLVSGLISDSKRVMQLQSPYFLQMLDSVYDGQSFYTIHEAPEACCSLTHFFEDKKSIQLNTLWTIGTQVMEALMELETKKLSYGSLNCSNIYWTDKGTVKLAKVFLPIRLYQAHMSDFNVVEDCIFYAPEYLQRQDHTIVSDIYSFGVLLYIFFSRQWPYPYTNRVHDLKKSLVHSPKPFTPISEKIPSKLVDLIPLCLCQDPKARIASFFDIVKFYNDREPMHRLDGQPVSTSIQTEIKSEIRQRLFSKVGKLAISSVMVVFILVFSFFLFRGYQRYFVSIPDQEVPDVIGLSLSDAERVIEDRQLSSVIAGERFHASYDSGLIIESKPAAGKQVKENRLIRLFISKGYTETRVPDFQGRSLEQALMMLDGKGVSVDVTSLFSLEYPSHTIIDQYPTPNHVLLATENIQLFVSKGYPVSVSVDNAVPNLFSKKEHMKLVKVLFFLQDNWPSQLVKVLFTYQMQQDELYTREHHGVDPQELTFELEKGGVLEVLFNDELALRYKIGARNRVYHDDFKHLL